MAGQASFAVVVHFDGSRLARQYRFLGIFGGCASAGCYNLVDNQRTVAHVGKGKGVAHLGTVFRKGAEVVRHTVKLDVGLLSPCAAQAEQQEHQGGYDCFHTLVFSISLLVRGKDRAFPFTPVARLCEIVLKIRFLPVGADDEQRKVGEASSGYFVRVGQDDLFCHAYVLYIIIMVVRMAAEALLHFSFAGR